MEVEERSKSVQRHCEGGRALEERVGEAPRPEDGVGAMEALRRAPCWVKSRRDQFGFPTACSSIHLMYA